MEANMTELEIMQHAKSYIDKMATGIDPISGVAVPETDCINQVRISRCLFYVSDILRKVIENGGVIAPVKKWKTQFSVSKEELSHFEYSDKPIPVSEITNRINKLVDPESTYKFKHRSITNYLILHGFMTENTDLYGKTSRVPTKEGIELGIMREDRNGSKGPYQVTVFNIGAQEFIIEHLDEILDLERHPQQLAELQIERKTGQQ